MIASLAVLTPVAQGAAQPSIVIEGGEQTSRHVNLPWESGVHVLSESWLSKVARLGLPAASCSTLHILRTGGAFSTSVDAVTLSFHNVHEY